MNARSIFALHLAAVALVCAPYALDTAYNILTDQPGHLPLIQPTFNLDEEMNLPATFSALGWMAVAAASLAIALREPARTVRATWCAAAAAAGFLGVDEAVQIHEQIAGLLLPPPETGFLWWPWVSLYAALAAAAVACGWRTFMTIPRQERLFILAGAGLFVIGALGFEIVGAEIVATMPYDAVVADPPTKYRLAVLCEEALEMIGVAFAVRGLIGAAAQMQRPVSREPAAQARSQPR